MKRLILGLGLVALATITAACSGASAAPSDGPVATPPAGAVVIVAKDLAWQPSAVTVKAGEPVTIVMDNQEDAPHNLFVKDSAGAEVFKGEIVSKQQITYELPALTAGTYPFICEVHPNMTGTITAE
jgi:plastocyanin